MIIKQKCLPEVFSKIEEGKRNSAVYVGKEKIKAGDFILFEEISHETGKGTGRKIKRKIVRASKSSENHLYWSEGDKEHGFTLIFFE